MEDELQARVQVRLADGLGAWTALPRWEPVSAGRTPGYGLHLANGWVPRKLCRFIPYEHGWVVQVGPRARMEVQDKYVGKHLFDRRAMVALQPGKARLAFPELDDWCEFGVVINLERADGLAVARDGHVVRDPELGGTVFAAERVVLTPAQRATVAVAFRHVLERGPAPVNYAEAAAPRLGTTKAMVLKRLDQVRTKINNERWGPKLTSHELVAHYLIRTTRTITWADLPAELRGG